MKGPSFSLSRVGLYLTLLFTVYAHCFPPLYLLALLLDLPSLLFCGTVKRVGIGRESPIVKTTAANHKNHTVLFFFFIYWTFFEASSYFVSFKTTMAKTSFGRILENGPVKINYVSGPFSFVLFSKVFLKKTLFS